MINQETDTPQSEIETRSWPCFGETLREAIRHALADGVALQFYATFVDLKKLVHGIDPSAHFIFHCF